MTDVTCGKIHSYMSSEAKTTSFLMLIVVFEATYLPMSVLTIFFLIK